MKEFVFRFICYAAAVFLVAGVAMEMTARQYGLAPIPPAKRLPVWLIMAFFVLAVVCLCVASPLR